MLGSAVLRIETRQTRPLPPFSSPSLPLLTRPRSKLISLLLVLIYDFLLKCNRGNPVIHPSTENCFLFFLGAVSRHRILKVTYYAKNPFCQWCEFLACWWAPPVEVFTGPKIQTHFWKPCTTTKCHRRTWQPGSNRTATVINTFHLEKKKFAGQILTYRIHPPHYSYIQPDFLLTRFLSCW